MVYTIVVHLYANDNEEDISKLKAKLDELSGTGNWRIHDLRRSGASMMQHMGVVRDFLIP